MRKTFILVILDGWGIGRNDQGNPIYTQHPKNIAYIREHYRVGSLQASGISVGLPWEETGNSEVGHLTLGAGKIIYQHLPRITLAIRNGTFFKNDVLRAAFAHAKQNKSAVNLVGLLTEGSVHASLEHIKALVDMAAREGISALNLHLFADGEDSKPKSFLSLAEQIPEDKIATISGRYFALDRNQHWERTKKTYEALIGIAPQHTNSAEYITNAYEKEPNDQFIEPFIVHPEKIIKENDSVIFFNFREDRMRQIVQPFIDPSFSEFPITHFKNLFVCTFTKYADTFPIPVAFEPEPITTTLGSVLADHEKTQLRIAETEKSPHITYFFNGYREEQYKNEYRVFIPSQNVSRLAEHPEMRAQEIGDRIVQAIEEHSFDFILANFANADMIAHTGDLRAAQKAVDVIDEQIGRIGKSAIDNNAILMITSDHGNIERVVEAATGTPQTQHDSNPVPIYLIGDEYYAPKTPGEALEAEYESVGILSDVAPTILEILGIPKPPEMTGESLLGKLY